MDKKLVILTGCNKGLGKAFFDCLIKEEDIDLITISRRLSKDQLDLLSQNKFQHIETDLSEGVSHINFMQYIPKYKSILFINNAFTIKPIKKVGKWNPLDIELSLKTNIISPTVLVNNLIGSLKYDQNLRLINISSGASIKPIKRWGIYCSSKAFNKMLYDVIGEESNILIENIDPGVLDTRMQKTIRESSEDDFPDVELFKNLDLSNTHLVAKSILGL